MAKKSKGTFLTSWGADSRARRRTYSPYKPPSKWQTPPNCHCEEAKGRRGALSAKREEVPLGCNLGEAVAISPMAFLLSGRVLRDCHVASLLAMTRQAGAVVHQCPSAVELSPTRRSMSAATDATGWYVLSLPCTGCKCLHEIPTSLRSSE